jgi:tetrahydromethanopterin S-methyltransferase subunit E
VAANGTDVVRAGALARRSRTAVRDCICSCWFCSRASKAGSVVGLGGWAAEVGGAVCLGWLGGVAVESESICSSCRLLERVVGAMDRWNLIPDDKDRGREKGNP